MMDGIDSAARAAMAGTARAGIADGRGGMASLIVLAVAGLGWPVVAAAQDGAAVPIVSRPVVEQVGGHTGSALSTALARLGRNPQDIEALIDAGNAALAAGDTDAAIGFFTRADRLSPGNARTVAGLAGARVTAGDGIGALPLFESIPQGAAIAPDRIADHGLADDLVGDNAGAQALYQQALAAGAGDEARRRLAISLAISGDSRGSAAALSPLLQKQDRAGWRTRAFCLAILGQEEDAVGIAKAIMPANLALGMAPYLRYMGRLTRAQQAAAANLGRFPLPSAIGIDDSRVVAWQQSHGGQRLAAAPTPRTAVAVADRVAPRTPTVDGELPPIGGDSGVPHGASASSPPPEPAPSIEARAPVATRLAEAAPSRPVTVAQPVVQQVRSAPSSVMPSAPPPVATSAYTLPPRSAEPAPSAPRPSFAEAFAAFTGTPATARPVAGAVDIRALDQAAAAPHPAATRVAAADPAPGFEEVDSRHRGHAAPAQPAPVEEAPARGKTAAHGADAAVDTPPRKGRHAADTASDDTRKTRHGADAAPADDTAGKSDTPAKSRHAADTADDDTAAKGAHRKGHAADTAAADSDDTGAGRHHKAAKPPVETHPSRIWVQVGIGRSDDRVAFDWKRMNKDDPKLFKGKSPSVTKWGVTRRVLVGPFETSEAANAYAAKVKSAGHGDAFVWTSPAGQQVDAVDAN